MTDSPIDQFRTTFWGEVVTAEDTGYDLARRVHNGLIDRRPAAVLRPRGVASSDRGGRFARAQGLPVAIRGGGAQRGRPRHLRRRPGDRPVADARRADRPGRPPGQGAGRRAPRRPRPGQPAVRAGGAERPGLQHRHGRADAERRHGLHAAQVRPDLRQPGLGSGRGRGRPPGHRQREREPRPVLGAPRRRRQLRRGHLVRVRPAPGRAADLRRADRLPDGPGGRGAQLPPGLHRRRAGGAQRGRDLPVRPAAGGHPGRAQGQAADRHLRPVHRHAGGGRAGRQAAAGVRQADLQLRRAGAVRDGPVDARRAEPEGLAQLLDRRVRADPGHHRAGHHRRARQHAPVARLDHPGDPVQRRRHQGSPGRHRVRAPPGQLAGALPRAVERPGARPTSAGPGPRRPVPTCTRWAAATCT